MRSQILNGFYRYTYTHFSVKVLQNVSPKHIARRYKIGQKCSRNLHALRSEVNCTFPCDLFLRFRFFSLNTSYWLWWRHAFMWDCLKLTFLEKCFLNQIFRITLFHLNLFTVAYSVFYFPFWNLLPGKKKKRRNFRTFWERRKQFSFLSVWKCTLYCFQTKKYLEWLYTKKQNLFCSSNATVSQSA